MSPFGQSRSRSSTTDTPELDPLDLDLLSALAEDGRLTNAALARRVGIAESTCIGRVRGLQQRGVIRGIRADIAPTALGRPLEAMVAVQFTGQRRRDVEAFATEVPKEPGVVALYSVTGENDFLVHLAVRNPGALRDFILDRLYIRPGVTHTETTLILDSQRGRLID